MKDVVQMISLEEALAAVRENAGLMPPVEVDLRGAAGRVLIEDIASDVDMPPFDKSAMDGYAVRAADVADAPVELRVVEDIPAGQIPAEHVAAGLCAKIMTGAPVPDGADAVVRVEDTEPMSDDGVRILRGAEAGANICVRGEDVRRGDTVVSGGVVLRPFHVALAAAAGRKSVQVYGTPRLAIVATGDELVETDQIPGAGQIRNSNSHAIAARLAQAGVDAEYLGIAPDEHAALKAALEDGLGRDMLIVSGGVSMGDHDLVPGVLKELGVEIVFDSVAIKPGRPTVFGRRGAGLVFGLPGNPVSTLIISELLLVPALRRMMGEEHPAPAMIEAIVDAPLSHKPKRTSFRPVAARWADGAWHAAPVEYHGSADLAGAARGNAFAGLPRGVSEVPAGATVQVLLFPEDWRAQYAG